MASRLRHRRRGGCSTSSPADSSQADTRPTFRIPGTRTGFRERGISPSHSPSALKDQREEQQQQAPRVRAQEPRETPSQDAAAAAAVESAGKAGIKPETAAELVAQHGGERVYNAVAEIRARKGAPIRDPARWVRSALERRFEIADHWAERVAREERAARLRGLAADDLRAMAREWNEQDREVIVAAFGTADSLAAWLDSEPFGMAWRAYGPARLGSKIAEVVRASLEVRR